MGVPALAPRLARGTLPAWLVAAGSAACGGSPVAELLPPPQPLRWARAAGGPGDDVPRAVVPMAEGFWVLVASAQGEPERPDGLRAGFNLLRLDSDGQRLDTVRLGLGRAEAVRMDLAGGIAQGWALAGAVSGPAFSAFGQEFEPTEGGGVDGFVARWLPGRAEAAWGRRFGGAGATEIRSVQVDDSGRTFVAGRFTRDLTIPLRADGSGPVATARARGRTDGFLAAFGPDGRRELLAGLGGPGSDEVLLGRTSAGSWVVAGQFEDRLFGPMEEILEGSGGPEPFVARIRTNAGSPTGYSFQWIRTLGEGNGTIDVIALDAGPFRVAVGGSFSGARQVDRVELQSGGGIDGYVVELATAGGRALRGWASGGLGPALVTGISLRATGGAWATGSFRGTLAAGSAELRSVEDGVLTGFGVDLDAAGSGPAWSAGFGFRLGDGPGLSTGGAMATVPGGLLDPGGLGEERFMAAVLGGRVGFGPAELESTGETDVLLLRFGLPLPVSVSVQPRGAQAP